MKKIALLICSLLIFAPCTSNSMKIVKKLVFCLPKKKTLPLSRLGGNENESSAPQSVYSEEEEKQEESFTEENFEEEVIENEKKPATPEGESSLKTVMRIGLNTTLGGVVGLFCDRPVVGLFQGFMNGVYHNKKTSSSQTERALLMVGSGVFTPIEKFCRTEEITTEEALKSAGMTTANMFVIPQLTDAICNKTSNLIGAIRNKMYGIELGVIDLKENDLPVV